MMNLTYYFFISYANIDQIKKTDVAPVPFLLLKLPLNKLQGFFDITGSFRECNLHDFHSLQVVHSIKARLKNVSITDIKRTGITFKKSSNQS